MTKSEFHFLIAQHIDIEAYKKAYQEEINLKVILPKQNHLILSIIDMEKKDFKISIINKSVNEAPIHERFTSNDFVEILFKHNTHNCHFFEMATPTLICGLELFNHPQKWQQHNIIPIPDVAIEKHPLYHEDVFLGWIDYYQFLQMRIEIKKKYKQALGQNPTSYYCLFNDVVAIHFLGNGKMATIQDDGALGGLPRGFFSFVVDKNFELF